MDEGARAGSDVYLDAVGVAVVPQTVTSIAKHGATLGVVAVHKKPVEFDFGKIVTSS